VQSWGDEDIPEVLDTIAETLREQAVHVSSWDKYKKEVLSGTLDWTPMHTSEVFWRNNVDKFEDKVCVGYESVMRLLCQGPGCA
jgi:V-type H+-transporting ATPase subunit H